MTHSTLVNSSPGLLRWVWVGWPALVLVLLMGLHGPIAQPLHYHEFADQAVWWGLPHARDVLSNLGFAVVGIWGGWRLAARGSAPELGLAWAGYRLFLLGLVLTAVGSAYYHLAPDNARLVWDRLPISLTCAGLLAGVWADTQQRPSTAASVAGSLLGLLGVVWWWWGERAGHGDLRLYLLLQGLCLVLILWWQHQARRPAAERLAFAGALALYGLAKLTEIYDHAIARALGGWITGHTLKHLLASAAAAGVVAALLRRCHLGAEAQPAACPKQTA